MVLLICDSKNKENIQKVIENDKNQNKNQQKTIKPVKNQKN